MCLSENTENALYPPKNEGCPPPLDFLTPSLSFVSHKLGKLMVIGMLANQAEWYLNFIKFTNLKISTSFLILTKAQVQCMPIIFKAKWGFRHLLSVF